MLETVTKMWIVASRVLWKHRGPPDRQEKATRTVIEQAELFSEEWASS